MTIDQPEALPAQEPLPGTPSGEARRAPESREEHGSPWKDWGLALAICFPALSLLLAPGKEFGLDWPGHLWMTAYFGEYFRHHLAFPEVLNTDWISAMPYPVFYGYLFFPVAGLCSVVLGADLAVRLIVAGVMTLQCRQAQRLMAAAGAPRGLAWTIAALFCWSTYFLTNLYNRGALPEYIAVSLLSCALSGFLRLLLIPGGGASKTRWLESFFYYALCAGTHPLTAVFGAIFVACLILASLPLQRRDQWTPAARWGSMGVLATALVLAPWVYATAQFHKDLAIHQDSMTRVMHFTGGVDRWDVRLCPLPASGPREKPGANGVEATPHLDAQVNVPLLLLALGLSLGLIRSGKRGQARWNGAAWAVSASSAALFLVALAASISPAVFGLLPAFCNSLQFAYRLVAYQNLALLALITGLLCLGPTAGLSNTPPWRHPWFQKGLLLLGLAGLGLKMVHAAAAMREFSPDGKQWRRDSSQLVHLPFEFYGWPAYGTPGPASTNCPPAEPLFLEVGTGRDFGTVAATAVNVERAQNRVIQAQPFPWSEVILDGRLLSPDQTCAVRQGYVVPLAPGAHEIAWRWRPDPLWSGLRLFSFLTAAGWFVLTVRPRPNRAVTVE